MRTPRDPGAVARLAGAGRPVDAVLAAWTDPGRAPEWHARARGEVRQTMPVLAAALDRLAAEIPGATVTEYNDPLVRTSRLRALLNPTEGENR